MDNFCNFNIIKKINEKKKYLLSASLFYLNDPYKDNSRYINGLKKLIEFLEFNKSFILRIYYDNSIFENDEYRNMFNILKKNKFVELTNYSCKKFLKNKYHIGIFGVLIRFLPIFYKNNQYDIIYIIDIDDNSYGYIPKYINKLENSDKNFIFILPINYSERYFNKLNNKFGNTIISNILVKDYVFDIKLFINFLNEIYNSDKIYKMLYNINKNFFNIKDGDVLSTYGVDEYFLNKYLLNLLNENKIFFLKENYYFDYFFKNLLILNNSRILNIYLKELITTFYKEINNKSYNNYELLNILKNCIKFNKVNNYYYDNFINNYFNFCEQFKNITIKYYNIAFFIFNEKYIDDLFNNNFCGISWYLKKMWYKIPKKIKKNIKI